MDLQIKILRKMTGEQRLEQAFQLSELTRELAILNIKENYPHLSHKGIIKKLRERIELGEKNRTLWINRQKLF